MPDFGSEVMAEALALVKPIYTIPIIPLSNSNQYRHQDHLDMKDYKKVRLRTFTALHWCEQQDGRDVCPSLQSVAERRKLWYS